MSVMRDSGGMLVIWTNVDPAVEPEFNRWYDREHVAERVAIPGFLGGRRLLARSGPKKYLALYPTESIETFRTPEYRKALAQQSDWSNRVMPNMRDTLRLVARETLTAGAGTGAAVAALHLAPPPVDAAALRDRLAAGALAEAAGIDGVIAVRLLEADPELSTPLGGAKPAAPVADWLLLVEAIDDAAAEAAAGRLGAILPKPATEGRFRLLWDLRRADL